jgi:sulfur relay (sulfurtransferase) DsrC/TusE family protein
MQRLAIQKKKENIAEYILYMYQMEDLIRAYQFNMEEIHQYVIVHYPISPEEKAEVLNWFRVLADKMKTEQIQEKGHLSEVQEKVEELTALHWSFLKSDRDYFNIYNAAKPHVINLVVEAGDENPGHEIQLCLNAIYGLLLSRLHGRKVPEEIIKATESFGAVLRYLTEAYHQSLVAKN